jgi:4-hydroxy-3-methylbut-2-enyl diphosphate reductase
LTKAPLKLLLAEPRGFCAGVDRAIATVESALKRFGPPIYIRHEIVHNRHVVDELKKKGAIFVDELSEVPDGFPVIFSAHGVPKSIFIDAQKRDMHYIDATCPLVTKVHVDAQRHKKQGKTVILIGHAGHPEVTGTLGQLSDDEMILVENQEQAQTIELPSSNQLSFVTQTTLSIDDTQEIIETLKRRFPLIQAPRTEDICYATTNRQAAVKEIANMCDGLIVLGAPNSSNSNRLAEVARDNGCPKSILIQEASELDPNWLTDMRTIGVTAGASAPEILVLELIQWFKNRFILEIENVKSASEDIRFSLPSGLN